MNGKLHTRRYPVAGPWITDLEVEYVADAARNAWFERAGEYPARFEEAFAKAVGRTHAVSLPSCTSALHLALAGLGIGPGDEVIVPELTWIATSAPIAYVGATPVFADVDPATWCLSAAGLEAAITPNTKAVIPVDLYGNMPDMDALLVICEKHGIAMIEDAAEAHGSRYKDCAAGSFGIASTFSFHGSKTLTTGEGGMLVTDDEALFARVMQLRDHGRAPGDTDFFNEEVAFKYKMSALQAALGLAQVERMDEIVDKKRAIFGWYKDALASLNGVQLNDSGPDVYNSYWMVTVVLEPQLGIPKDVLKAALFDDGVDTRPFFHPLSSIPAYQGLDPDAVSRHPHAYAVAASGLNLPSALTLSQDDVREIARIFSATVTRLSAG